MPVSLFGTRRWLALLVSLLLSGALVWTAGRIWLADSWARSSSPESWERAAELEPTNAEHWQRLGRFRQWDFENTDLALAQRHFERAVALVPASPFLWMDLGSVYEMQGDTRRAREAFDRAKRNYPISSEVAWNYGNFLLRAGQMDAAFAEIHRAIEQNPSLVPLAVSVCWRGGAGPDRILRDVLPARSSSYLDAIDVFLAERELDAALGVWKRLETLRQPLEFKRSLPLQDVLLQNGRVADAVRVWQYALEASHWPDGRAGHSLIWDGGFEQDFLNGGFGWRQAGTPGVGVEFDSGEFHSGARSLLLRFDGSTNVDMLAPLQFVAVQPRTHYRFAASLKLDGVTTGSGISFLILDAGLPRTTFVFTPALIGSQPWTQQEAEFTTGPETLLVQIALRRAPSTKLDNKIAGAVWVDDVSLTPILSAGEPPR